MDVSGATPLAAEILNVCRRKLCARVYQERIKINTTDRITRSIDVEAVIAYRQTSNYASVS
jgi:hypothetical protein